MAFVCVAATRAEEASSSLQLVEQTEGWLVREGDRDVLFYQRAAKSRDGEFTRAHYVHPLYSLDGQVLTEDFPQDHLHHRGVFWAWHQLLVGEQPIGDGWACRDMVWNVAHVEPVTDAESSVALRTHVVWKSPQRTNAAGTPKPLVQERTTIRVHAADHDARKIDFEIQLLAAEENLRLGGSDDEKGYGGFSVRVRLPEGVRFTGAGGTVEPQLTAVDTGAWLDVSAPYDQDGALSGVTILPHPSSPGFPQPWILRRERSMQNAVWPGREPVQLSTESPVILRYRLVLHRGGADRERIERWASQYAEQ
jgi:hypothetical protein